MVIDLHCDTFLRLMEGKNGSDLYENNLNVDIKKLIKGKSLAQFLPCG